VSDETESVTPGHAPVTPSPEASEEPEASPDRLVEDLDEQEAGLIAAYDRLSLRWKLLALVGIIVVLALIFSIWHDFYWHWFEVHSGTVNESGPYYGFWSGFGSDIGEATLVAGVFALWRHHSCHVRGCARFGRPVSGTPYLACPKHHPAHTGNRRSVSLETIHAEHDEAKRASHD
jgi:hypothetical protein